MTAKPFDASAEGGLTQGGAYQAATVWKDKKEFTCSALSEHSPSISLRVQRVERVGGSGA